MVNLTEAEMRTVQAVICEVAKMPFSKMNTFLGSMTCEEVSKLASKFWYAGYCERHGIKYEDMTEWDYEEAAMEEWDYKQEAAMEAMEAMEVE